MIMIQNSNVPEVTCSKHCWKMLLTKKQSELVQQVDNNVYMWNVVEHNCPQRLMPLFNPQEYNQTKQKQNHCTVSTQQRRRVPLLVLEPLIGAIGLSMLRIAFGKHPLYCVIFPIFPLVTLYQFWTHIPNTGGRMDFARWRCKPNSASSNLQALYTDFVVCNCSTNELSSKLVQREKSFARKEDF